MSDVATVLCIPGTWADRADLIASLVDNGTDYLFAGGILMHLPTGFTVSLEFEDQPDPNLAPAFRSGGMHWAESPEMTAIDSHSSIAYLVGDGGSRDAAEQLMRAATALLQAGGLGVKVESSGLAHSKTTWLDLTGNVHLFSAYRAYVVTVGSESEIYSCGMHTFGQYDVRVDAAIPDAGVLAGAFTHYLFSESPQISAGQTFSPEPDAPRYRIESTEPIDYGPDSLFTNPYGTWRLVPID